jgi:hypothetical protein
MTLDQALTLPEARQLYRWTAQLFDILAGLKRRFGGDLDQYLLYMVFVQAEMARTLGGHRPPAGLNALSAAEICGIPRETSRNKLRRLAHIGLLRVDTDGMHYLSGNADALGEYGVLDKIAKAS